MIEIRMKEYSCRMFTTSTKHNPHDNDKSIDTSCTSDRGGSRERWSCHYDRIGQAWTLPRGARSSLRPARRPQGLYSCTNGRELPPCSTRTTPRRVASASVQLETSNSEIACACACPTSRSHSWPPHIVRPPKLRDQHTTRPRSLSTREQSA